MDSTQKMIRQLRAKKAEIENTLALLEENPNVQQVMACMASVGIAMPGQYKRKARVGLHWTQKPENRERVIAHLGKMAIRIDRRGTPAIAKG